MVRKHVHGYLDELLFSRYTVANNSYRFWADLVYRWSILGYSWHPWVLLIQNPMLKCDSTEANYSFLWRNQQVPFFYRWIGEFDHWSWISNFGQRKVISTMPNTTHCQAMLWLWWFCIICNVELHLLLFLRFKWSNLICAIQIQMCSIFLFAPRFQNLRVKIGKP